MNFPSLENFTMRPLAFATCPSLTKMSPFGATTTSVGPLNVSGPSLATPALPSVINTFPSGLSLEDLLAFSVLVLRVGHPDVAVTVYRHAVRLHEHPCAKAFNELSDGSNSRIVGSLR